MLYESLNVWLEDLSSLTFCTPLGNSVGGRPVPSLASYNPWRKAEASVSGGRRDSEGHLGRGDQLTLPNIKELVSLDLIVDFS